MRAASSKSGHVREGSERATRRTRSASPHDIAMDLKKLIADKAKDEMRLAALVETTLRAIYPCEVVKVENGVFTVNVEAPPLLEAGLVAEYNQAAERIPGVKRVRVHVLSPSIQGRG